MRLDRPALEVAPTLLGAYLEAGGVRVRLTEVEAYAGEGEDPGSHAHRGRTPRSEIMFGRAGLLYVYFSYGMHWCANVVTGPEGAASAVLFRAGEVVAGVEAARERRPGSSDRDLCRGPARLSKALRLDGTHLGADLQAAGGAVHLVPGDPPASGRLCAGPRVGVAGEGARTAWRFWLSGEPTVSSYRAAVTRSPRSKNSPVTAPTQPAATQRPGPLA